MVGRYASGCLLGAWLRVAEGRYADGGAGVSGATLRDTALVLEAGGGGLVEMEPGTGCANPAV